MRYVLALAPLLASLVSCSDDGGSCDIPTDDMFDNGTCGDATRVAGEVADWDEDSSFCGIMGATITASGAGGTTAGPTPPNGRFDVCTPGATSQLAVTLPTAMSGCTTPPSTYTTPTIAIIRKDVILSGAFYSVRSFTDARKTSFFADVVGAPFDASKAQVFVHVHGTPRPLTLAGTHGTTVAVADTTWAPGDTGHEVFFPNVDVGSGTAELSTTGCAVGTGAIPLTAGTITNVTINSL